jgi:hypothetical protein
MARSGYHSVVFHDGGSYKVFLSLSPSLSHPSLSSLSLPPVVRRRGRLERV